jgi:plastocyanin
MTRIIYAAGFAFVCSILGVCSPAGAAAAAAGAAAPPTVAVNIENFTFSPAQITIPPGTHVVFTNHDDTPHSVVVPDLKLRSPLLDTDDKFDAAMDRPGTYVFFCSLHPMMTGKIIVSGR